MPPAGVSLSLPILATSLKTAGPMSDLDGSERPANIKLVAELKELNELAADVQKRLTGGFGDYCEVCEDAYEKSPQSLHSHTNMS